MGVTSGCLDWRVLTMVHCDAVDCPHATVLGRDLLRRVYRLALDFRLWGGGGGEGAEGVAKGKEGFWCESLLLIKLPTFATPYIISPMRSGRWPAVVMQEEPNSRNDRHDFWSYDLLEQVCAPGPPLPLVLQQMLWTFPRHEIL